MTISKTNFNQQIETVNKYAPKATGAVLVADGAVRIIQTIFAKKKEGSSATAASPTDSESADKKNVKFAPKRNWDILDRFKLTPVQNGIIALTEMVAGAYLLSKK